MIMHFRIRNWDRLVGIFAILALLILIATLVFMAWGQNWFEKRYHYRAAFDKVQGLKPGTPVTISGMEVGSVKFFRLDPQGKVEVHLEVLETYRKYIRADSEVTIAAALLGGKTVEIGMGSPGQPAAAEGQILPSQESRELSDLIQEIDLKEPLKKVEEAVENLKNLTGKLNSPEGELFTILTNLQTITTRIKEGEGAVGAILQDRKLYPEIKAAVETANRSAARMEEAAQGAAEAVRELPALLQQAHGRIREVQGILEDVRRATSELPAIVENVRQASGQAPAIAADVKDISRDLKGITGDVRKATPELPELLGRTQEAVEEADRILLGLQQHWLIRGLMPAPRKDSPVAIGQRQSPYQEKGDAPR